MRQGGRQLLGTRHRKNAGYVDVYAMLLFAMISLFTLWFSLRPETMWERKLLRIPANTASAHIGQDEIFQTLTAPEGIRGIRVRFSDHGRELSGPWIFSLYDSRKTLLEKVSLQTEDISKDGYTDIVFPEAHGAGDYTVGAKAGADARGTLSIFESQQDVYKDGESVDADLERKNCDWSFHLLVPFPRTLESRHKALKTVGVVLSVLLFAAGIIISFRQRFPEMERRIRKAEGYWLSRKELVFILLLALLPVILYVDFLAGDRYHVFTKLDRGADSCAQTLPTLLYLARRLTSGRISSIFNFSLGLGVKEKGFFPTLTNWVAMFGEDRVAYLLCVSQCLKVFGSGLFAFLLAREFQTGSTLAFAAAVGYECNAMVIDRGAWETYPNLSLLVILWLYAFERARRKRRYPLFCAVTLLFFSGTVLFDCVFYGVLFLGYILMRCFVWDRAGSRAERNRQAVRAICLYIVFFLLGSLDTLRTGLQQAIRSSRMAENLAQMGQLSANGVWSSASVWMTTFLRLIGHSICGITESTGYNSLLSGPAFYCGISAFLLLPCALSGTCGRKRRGYLFCLAAGVFYIAFIPFRTITSGFVQDNFKLSSFWITIVVFLLLLELFACFRRGADDEKRKWLIPAAALISYVLLFAAWKNDYVLDREAFACSAFFILFYLLVFVRGNPLKNRAMAVLLVLGVCAEGVSVTWNVISDRDTYSRLEMTAASYHDHSADVIRQLKQEDESWYRIDKQFDSEFLADSLAQDYYGVKSYVGGTEIDRSVLELYENYRLPKEGNHYLQGIGFNIYFASVAGVRYFLTKDSYTGRYGFSFLRGDGGVNVFQNEMALPPFYLTENDTVPCADVQKSVQKGKPLSCTKNENGIFTLGEPVGDRVLVFDLNFSEEAMAYMNLRSESGEIIAIPFAMQDHTVLEIYAQGLRTFWFSDSAFRSMDAMSVYAVDSLLYYEDFIDETKRALETVKSVHRTGENSFSGVVAGDREQFLATVIPYDPQWRILVDDEPCATFPVRGGFLGTGISRGEHTVKIYYENSSWLQDHFFKVLGGILLILVFFAGEAACRIQVCRRQT